MTPKQQAFVREYLIDRNATQAAIRAGYSPDTAYSIGNENLRKPEIMQAIEVLEAEHRERCNVTVEALTNELYLARDLAHSAGQPSAAVSAIMGIAKLHGLVTDKRINENIVRPVRELSDAELLAIINGQETSPAPH